ncbi:MAG: DUF5004 domain-containing protein [Bacteroidia bacterium]
MKINLQRKVSLASIATAAILFNFQACKKYEEGPGFTLKTPKGRLTGDWELVATDPPSGADLPDLSMEFEKDGDFTMRGSISYYGMPFPFSVNGEWEFDDKKETLLLEVDSEETEWQINKLTSDELWVEDEDGYEYEFEKE